MNMAPGRGGGDIFTPSTPHDILTEAQMLVLRQMNQSLAALTEEMVAHRAMMTEIKIDVGAMKVRQETADLMQGTIDKLQERVNSLENRNERQDGALSFVTFLKEFGPWLVSLVILAWSFLARSPR